MARAGPGEGSSIGELPNFLLCRGILRLRDPGLSGPTTLRYALRNAGWLMQIENNRFIMVLGVAIPSIHMDICTEKYSQLRRTEHTHARVHNTCFTHIVVRLKVRREGT